MTPRHGIGIALTKKSLSVIKSRKRLLLIPAASIAVTITLAVLILTPLFQIEAAALKGEHIALKTVLLFFLLILLFFACVHFITTISNALLTTCLINQMSEKPATLWMGIKTTTRKLRRIILWAYLLGTAGIVIRFCEIWLDNWKTYKITQRLLLGMRWLDATYLVIPLLVHQNRSAFDTITESARLMKTTWGEHLKSRLRIGFPLLAAYLLALLPALLTAYFFDNRTYIHIATTISIALVITLAILKLTTRITITTALYLFAIGDKQVEQFYDANLLKKAFHVKK